MDNPETRSALDTRHRTKTNKTIKYNTDDVKHKPRQNKSGYTAVPAGLLIWSSPVKVLSVIEEKIIYIKDKRSIAMSALDIS